MRAPARKRYERYRHATTWSNYVTIAVDGIQVGACPEGTKTKAVWLHKPEKTPWAILHTMQRHNVDLANIIVLELWLDSHSLKKFAYGCWYSEQDIAPTAIRAVYSGPDLASETPTDRQH